MARRLDAVQEVRLQKLKKLQKLGIDPYPASFDITHSLEQAKKAEGEQVRVAGRLWSLREHGAFTFADLRDESGQIQLWFRKEILGDNFKILELLDIGDFLGVSGKVVKTKAGEITVDVSHLTLLTKSLRPLPSSWYGLKDVEERYRRRYLDLLFNPEVRRRFDTRARLIAEIRRRLDGLGFWEVETPILQALYGGTNAKPFKTYINALGQDFYLRIAPELYLKRLVIGGYGRLYEIAKDFRNEGMDLSHNPEFTMLEFYEAYADYNGMMDRAEDLFRSLATAVLGTTIIQVGKHNVDLGKKWQRVTLVGVLKQKLDLDVEKESEKSLVKYCKENKIALVGGESKGQLIFLIFEHEIPETLIEPTWVVDYPQEVSPLAKAHQDKPGWVQRFEGYVGGEEICDGWSELTNSLEQRERFEQDVAAARKDKEEAQQVDEDFLEAMEYGMPPLGGIGIGIDRLTMFYTNTWSIKEVILFPLMRRRG